MTRGLSVVILTALLVGLAGWGVTNGQGDAPAECSVTLSEDQSIQAAIDDARRGDVICLEAGTWQESIVINKTLTLQGIGDERTTIKATKDDQGDFEPVIGVDARSQEVTVIRLRNLELTGSKAETVGALAGGIFALSRPETSVGSASLIFQEVRISDNIIGMTVFGPNVSVRLAETVIEDNRQRGIGVIGASTIRTSNTVIADNGIAGLQLSSGAEAFVQETTIRGHVGVPSSPSGLGVDVGNNSRLKLVNSRVIDNGQTDKMALFNAGIRVGFGLKYPGGLFSLNLPAEVNIINSQIDGNRQGVLLGGQADLRLEDATVRNNRGWGLAGMTKPCLKSDLQLKAEALNGAFRFAGRNVIKGNNAAGELSVEGNPGRHPFHYLPDGQVCLPR
ncbi:MAG: right-handed parallel beta-helix repeat-containing protein [Candidatus Bipolaricaulia bacterium]